MLPLGAIIPLAGAAGAALGMPIGQMIDAPRKAAWNWAFGTDSGDELAKRILTSLGAMPQKRDIALGGAIPGAALGGAQSDLPYQEGFTRNLAEQGALGAMPTGWEPGLGNAIPPGPNSNAAGQYDSTPLSQALGATLEMALDPFTIGGSLLGGLAGTKLFNKMQPVVAKAPLQKAMGRLDEVEGMIGRHMPMTKGGFTIPPTSMTDSTYIPELLEEFPDIKELGKSARSYTRVDPKAAELTERLGLGYSGEGGLNVLQPPSFLEGRDGKMFLSPASPTGMSYEDTLIGLPKNASGDTVGSTLGHNMAKVAREEMPWARAGRVGKMDASTFSTDDGFGGEHLMDMTMADAPGQINALRAALLGRMRGVNSDLSRNSPAGAIPSLMNSVLELASRRTPASAFLPPTF